jgi:hypothetical protein
MRRFKPLIPIVIVVTVFAIALIVQAVRAMNCSDRGGIVIGSLSRSQSCAER